MAANRDALLLGRLLQLVSSREYPKTLCPSEVPRSLTRNELTSIGVMDWKSLMTPLRTVITELRQNGELEVLQRGEVVNRGIPLDDVKGPIRIRKIQP